MYLPKLGRAPRRPSGLDGGEVRVERSQLGGLRRRRGEFGRRERGGGRAPEISSGWPPRRFPSGLRPRGAVSEARRRAPRNGGAGVEAGRDAPCRGGRGRGRRAGRATKRRGGFGRGAGRSTKREGGFGRGAGGAPRGPNPGTERRGGHPEGAGGSLRALPGEITSSQGERIRRGGSPGRGKSDVGAAGLGVRPGRAVLRCPQTNALREPWASSSQAS
jgi:hypothetical protein